MELDYELIRECRHLNNDKMMTERAVESEKKRWETLLKGSVGQDIKDVLSGKKKVKLSFKERFNFKVKKYKNKVKKMFCKNEKEFV